MAVLPLLLVWLTGLLLVAVLNAPPLSRRSFSLADLPLAFGAGAVLQHLSFLLWSWRGTVPLWTCATVPALLAAAFCWQANRGRTASLPEHSGRRLSPLAWSGLGSLLLVQALMLLPVVELPLFDWEGRMLWAIKAKFLAADFTVAAEPFRDPYRLHIHPRYPLLVPWLTALSGRASGGFQEWHYLAVVGSFALLTTWQLYRYLARSAGLLVALGCCVVLIATSAWYTATINLQVEVVLAFYLLAALCRLAEWLDTGHWPDLFLAGILLAGAAMTKNEGVLLAACASGALAAASWQRGRVVKSLAPAATLLVVVLLLILPWLLQLSAIPAVSDENYLQRLNFTAFAAGAARLPLILRSFAGQMADWALWQLFWLIAPLLVLLSLALWRKITPLVRLAAFVWIGYFSGILVVYVLSPWADIALHVNSSFSRVMLPLLPCSMLLLGQLAWRCARNGSSTAPD